MPPSSSKPFPFRISFPPELPVSARAEDITAAIAAHQVVIVAGETGSGKTTQLPKLCLAAGRGLAGRIACTQPRRVAALSLSRRVAEELGVEWGREVGCKIRFNDHTAPETVIKFLTDGLLLAEAQGDPLLRAYDTLIVDEAHERSLNIDFLLGHLRSLRHRRPDLKIIITSATIDTAAFSAAFDGAPVIEVSGRTFPVDVIYEPLDELRAETADATFIDAAVDAVTRIVETGDPGDVLVFMPGEREIRETCDLLGGKKLPRCELVPLFGRLAAADQQQVFAPCQRRKIVVATNVAETSLTIPGVRFVVDTGLARISRYSPSARTRRLPIEPIAQANADQRRGRAGRVAPGVCIRLYSEEDFNARPRFAQPEIQRANLADVTLRLLAHGLGDIARFPFLNPPAPKAIRAGQALLEELGALEPPASEAELHRLTPLGRELARLPVDPTVARMILQARGEKCLREVLIIAAGLSIQDPRERPLEQQIAADAAHRRFAHPDSDFLTLLGIWDAYHDDVEKLTLGRLRRFCREHFLSFTRMREWRDLHAQLADTLRQRDDFRPASVFDGLKKIDEKTLAFGGPAYRAIHRSILTGLLGNIAVRDEENGGYRATHDRRTVIFPGSVLFQKSAPKKFMPGQKPAPKKESRGPRWLLAAEIVETSRLYARTCARLDPAWVLELGAHLVKVSHSEPFWSVDAGRVMVKQRTRLYGLELETRAVGFGKIDPAQATEIFIREALVADTVTWPFDFLAHNRRVLAEAGARLTRLRDAGFLNLDETAFRFYAAKLTGEAVSAVAELVDLVRDRRTNEPDFLQMTPADLHGDELPAPDAAAFPPALPIGQAVLPLAYAYQPGRPEDGVTLEVNIRDAAALTPAALDWAVPGHLADKIEHYLRTLPKELRRAFVPLAETARALAAELSPAGAPARNESLPEALAERLREKFQVRVDPTGWAAKPPPDHLRVRIRVLDDAGRELCASREFAEIHAALAARHREASAAVARDDSAAWRAAREKWERLDQTAWTFGDVPARLLVDKKAGVPVYAYPGLKPGAAGVALKLFPAPEEAAAATGRGLFQLFELQLRHDLGWLQRDLAGLRALGPLAAVFAPLAQLQADAFAALREWVCARPVEPLAEAAFFTALARARADLRGRVPALTGQLREILELRQTLLAYGDPYPKLADDVAALLPPDFLRTTAYPRLAHFSRYLKARKQRVERWRRDPAKDAGRAAQLAPYAAAAAKLGRADPVFWLVEEFRVSLFAQELGTDGPVSAARLDRILAGGKPHPSAPEAAAPKPAVAIAAAPVPAARTAPLKSFGALGFLRPG